MGYCCAVGSLNDSRFVSKGQGISFHRFPTEVSFLKEWLEKYPVLALRLPKILDYVPFTSSLTALNVI